LQGKKYGFKGYINTLENAIQELNTQTSSPSQATIMSRILSDLVVLDHFSKAYQGEVTTALDKKDYFEAFKSIYQEHKGDSSVYEHRLDSILGDS